MSPGWTDPHRLHHRTCSTGRPRGQNLRDHLLEDFPSGLPACFPGLWTPRQPAISLAPPSSVLVARYVSQYFRGCSVCAISKTPHHLPAGKLVPLPIPRHPWYHVWVEFVTDLPKSEGYTCILIAVDRFSKACKLIPLRGLPTARETVEDLFHNLFRTFGIPEDVISNRGPQFVSRGWKAFFKLLDVNVSLSSGYHPQTNGQTEWKIQEIGRYLRAYCHDNQHSWNRFLPWARVCTKFPQANHHWPHPFSVHTLLPIPPEGPALISPGPWNQDCLRSLLLETTVLRPASSLRKTKEPESAQAGPSETRLAGASTPPGDLLREPVSRDWPLVYLELLAWCFEAGDRQETADLAALETPEGVASLPTPLYFWAEETERSACWRPLRSWTRAGLADRSPEGTEERRAPCDAVYTALSQRGLPSKALGHWHQDVLSEDYPVRMAVRRSVFGPGAPLWLRLWFWEVREVTFLEWGAGTRLGLLRPAAPADHLNLLRGREVNIVLSLERNALQRGIHDQPLLFFSRELSVRAPLPRHVFSITLFCFIFIHNMLVQTLCFVKAHRRPPCPPPRKKTGGASNSFSRGKNRGAGFRSQSIGSDWKGRR